MTRDDVEKRDSERSGGRRGEARKGATGSIGSGCRKLRRWQYADQEHDERGCACGEKQRKRRRGLDLAIGGGAELRWRVVSDAAPTGCGSLAHWGISLPTRSGLKKGCCGEAATAVDERAFSLCWCVPLAVKHPDVRATAQYRSLLETDFFTGLRWYRQANSLGFLITENMLQNRDSRRAGPTGGVENRGTVLDGTATVCVCACVLVWQPLGA